MTGSFSFLPPYTREEKKHLHFMGTQPRWTSITTQRSIHYYHTASQAKICYPRSSCSSSPSSSLAWSTKTGSWSGSTPILPSESSSPSTWRTRTKSSTRSSATLRRTPTLSSTNSYPAWRKTRTSGSGASFTSGILFRVERFRSRSSTPSTTRVAPW